jgi:hypothetical protein
MTIHDFFSHLSVDLAALVDFLDQLEPAARLREVRSLGARQQATLFDAAAGFRPVRLSDFVPVDTPAFQEVIHSGRNSLPIFCFFEKRFCLPEAPPDELWGYNEWTFRALTGPGYFIARQAGELEVVIDYHDVPPAKPLSWPPLLPNSARLGRFVYYQTRDFMRGVSQDVMVGRATRQGKPLDNWFVLCRVDNPPRDRGER